MLSTEDWFAGLGRSYFWDAVHQRCNLCYGPQRTFSSGSSTFTRFTQTIRGYDDWVAHVASDEVQCMVDGAVHTAFPNGFTSFAAVRKRSRTPGRVAHGA